MHPARSQALAEIPLAEIEAEIDARQLQKRRLPKKPAVAFCARSRCPLSRGPHQKRRNKPCHGAAPGILDASVLTATVSGVLTKNISLVSVR